MNQDKKDNDQVEESNESVAQSMTMMQDTFMRVVFEDPACVEAVI